jgi:hypothetical protein
MSKMLYQHRLLKEAAELAVAESKDFDGLSADILTDVVVQTLHQYQQKVNVGVQDSVADLLETFKRKAAEAIFDKAAGWRMAAKQPFLLPRNCRFCFAKGASTIFVIEQEPQLRSLVFNRNMLGSINPNTVNPQVGDLDPERLPFALPYAVFVLHFRNGHYSGVYSGWRTTPLRSLDDELSAPALPNLHDNLNVCMGRHFCPEGDSMSDMADSVIGTFWNSRFNNDLSAFWWDKSSLDARLVSGRAWSTASIEDPLFVLGVNFHPIPGKTVRYLADALTQQEDEKDENVLRHELSDGIDAAADALFTKIVRYFKKTKFDKHHPSDIKERVAKVMRVATGEFADVLMALDHGLSELRRELETTRPAAPVQKGPLWTSYSP